MFGSAKNLYFAWGRVTAEPKFFPASGNVDSRLQFSIAVNEKNEDPLYWDCIAWGKLAETLTATLVKGKPIAVSGAIKASSYTPQGSTEKRTKLTIRAESVDYFPKDKFSPQAEDD